MSDLDKQLFNAVISNDLDLVKNLIEHGADIDIKDNKYQMTPLMYAIHFGYTDMANFFIDNNAELDEQNIHKETALIQAIYVGNADIVKKLIEHGADVNVKDETETTAFNYVKDIEDEKIQEDIIKLLNNAEQIRQKYLQKLNNQLFEAVQDENLEEVKNLIEQGADVNAKDTHNTVVLTYAVCRNYTDIIKILIKNGAKVNIKDKHEHTPLTRAMANDKKDIIEIFINNKCIDVNEVIDEFGNTLLTTAISRQYKNTAEMLINKGANLNTQNKNGDTPLMIAIGNFRGYLLKKFLKCDMDVNIQNKNGKTALIKMLENYEDEDDIKIIKKLCKLGANPYINDNTKRDAFEYIKDIEDEEIQKEITKLLNNAKQIRRNYLNEQLLNAVKDENLEKVEKLINQGADVNAQNSTKSTPLMIAAFLNNEQMVKFLINKGANTSIQNKYGYTVLCYAKYNKNENIQKQIRRKRCIEIDNFDDAIEEFSENMTDKSNVTSPTD